MTKKTKAEAVLRNVEILCPTNNQALTVPAERASFWADSYECEGCGSHGSVEVTVTCPCGNYHKIELYSW